jgi:CHAT domain-containing protein
MARKTHDEIAVKRYLLNQLSDPERQEIELRLLTDDDFAAEVEIVEDELIDEYVANELSMNEREQFHEHFLINPVRESKLQSSYAVKRYFDRATPQPQPSPGLLERTWTSLKQLFTSSPVPAVVTVAVIAVFGLLAGRLIFIQSDLKKGLVALNKAYSQERPIEARISNLGYARYEPTRSNQPPRVDTTELKRAERFLLDAEQASHDAASLHALGQYFLLQKEPNRAIDYLERARKANGSDAQIYADLGAAYFEKGKLDLDTTRSDNAAPGTGSGVENLGRSVEYLRQALELDPNLLPALFNLALVHEYQDLDGEAEADWRAYLQKDPNSEWSREATQRLKVLEEKKNRSSQTTESPLVAFLHAYNQSDEAAAWTVYRRNPGQYGNAVTQGLIDRFLTGNDHNQKNEALQALLYLGQLELRNAQDNFTADLAQFYASMRPETQAMMVEARRQFTNAQSLLQQSEIDLSIKSLEQARGTFEAVDNFPELIATDIAIAHGSVVQPDLKRTNALLLQIVPDCEARHYRWMRAQALAERAHLQTNLNNYSEAVADSKDALQTCQELKDVEGVVGSLIQLAGLYLFLNDNETSFSFLRQAIAVADEENAKGGQRWSLNVTISLNLYALKLYRAALDYQTEALRLALTSAKPRPLIVSRSYQYVGLTYGSLQRFDLALENLQKAYEQGQPLAAERNGRNMMASASLKLGDLYRVAGEPLKSLSAYDESSRLYESIGFDHYSYAAHKGKFLLYLAQKDDAMAQQELQVVLGLFDKYREQIVDERQKTFFFDREQDTYDLAIDFTYARIGDQQRAFDYSETCRARNLHDLMSHGAEITTTGDLRAASAATAASAPALTVTEVQQRLPEQVQLVQYAVLDQKVLLWLITRSEVVSKSVDIDSSKLNDAVATALRQIKDRDENGAQESLKQLYALVIGPIEAKLDSSKVICFVPDKILHYLPFDALISASSGRYLAQDYRMMTSPSATILIESTDKATARAALKEERLLAVGNPTLDRRANPDLPSLPGSQREVEKIALNYPSRRVLVQRQATRKSVMSELPRAQVAHFATHYQIDPRSKLSSKLVLSPDGDDQSGLNSGDIYQMNLDHTKLVVLAACQTGIEQQFGGEGPIGFARSFLVAGVPVVVASLWPVDSEATSDLMVAFHRFRKDGKSTTQALQLAQQEIMDKQNYRSPYYWAGFTTIGGYSEF